MSSAGKKCGVRNKGDRKSSADWMNSGGLTSAIALVSAPI